MVALLLAESQILILSLDVVNAREKTNLDLYVFWQVIYMSSLFMTTFIIPFGYFFYESDEDKDYKTRFCLAFKYMLILFMVLSIIHFPMFAMMRHAYIPVEYKTYLGLQKPES